MPTNTPEYTPTRFSEIPTPTPLSSLAAASALVLASCASTGGGMHDDGPSMQEIRAEAEQDLDKAIEQTRQQKRLLAQVEQAGGGTRNRQLPAQASVPPLNDVRPLSEQSVLGIVNQGRDPRPTRPATPHLTAADHADYRAQTGRSNPMMALAEQQVIPPDSDTGENTPAAYTPSVSSNAAAEAVYVPKPRTGRRLPRPKDIGPIYKRQPKPSAPPSSVRSNRIPVSLSALAAYSSAATPPGMPQPSNRQPVGQAAAKEKWAGYSGSLRPQADKVLHLPTQQQPKKIDARQYGDLMKELDAPLNGTVRVSMVLAAVAKAIGYEFVLKGEDKDFSMKFEKFNGTVLDLLKAVGGENGLAARGNINVLPEQKRIILKYN